LNEAVVSQAIVRQRLSAQGLSQPRFDSAEDVVRRLAAVQAQDYAGAKWALGQRVPGLTDAAVEQAFAAGRLIRTHLLRPTWHFVVPEDLRPLLALTGARVKRTLAHFDRRLELDDALFGRSQEVITGALAGGQFLTRAELGAALSRAGITATGQRLGQIVMHAELDAVICSGPRRGKQHTYALLEERVPPATVDLEAALVELVWRYFSTRGPATIRDFVWWSGLTGSDARAGLAHLGDRLVQARKDGRDYWLAPAEPAPLPPSPWACLLPNYDEYFIGLADRGAIAPEERNPLWSQAGVDLIHHILTLDGMVVGGWRGAERKKQIVITLQPLVDFATEEWAAIEAAAEAYSRFLAMPVVVEAVPNGPVS
jgi:hypothetical protein